MSRKRFSHVGVLGDVIAAALSRPCRTRRLPAAGRTISTWLSGTNPPTGRYFVNYEMLAGSISAAVTQGSLAARLIARNRLSGGFCQPQCHRADRQRGQSLSIPAIVTGARVSFDFNTIATLRCCQCPHESIGWVAGDVLQQ